MSLIHQRSQAIRALIAEVQATKKEEQPESEAFIRRIKAAVNTLSLRTDLFPIDSFPIKLNTHAGLYRLGEDSDGQNALYITGGIYGKVQTKPHTHPAWVSMGAVKGLERNRIYRRTDDASVEGQGQLASLEVVDVVPGEPAFIGSGLFHTLEVDDDIQTLHLHLYDAGLDDPANANLPVFNSADSSDYVRTPAATQRQVVAGVHPATFSEVSAAVASGLPLQLVSVDHQDTLWEKLAPSQQVSLADWEASSASLHGDPSIPVVLLGETRAVELAAQRLVRRGYSYFTHLR
ncbi:MAG: hypothetical protein ABW202_14245 [Duganella sp.]